MPLPEFDDVRPLSYEALKAKNGRPVHVLLTTAKGSDVWIVRDYADGKEKQFTADGLGLVGVGVGKSYRITKKATPNGKEKASWVVVEIRPKSAKK